MLITPGTQPERIRIFRDAYASALKDPELRVETDKARMSVDHTPGAELEDLIKKMMNQPKEVLDRAKKMLAN